MNLFFNTTETNRAVLISRGEVITKKEKDSVLRVVTGFYVIEMWTESHGCCALLCLQRYHTPACVSGLLKSQSGLLPSRFL